MFKLITHLKSNMKNKFAPLFHKLLLRKRYIVETVFRILKEEFYIEHSRHQSLKKLYSESFMSISSAYCLRPFKPTIRAMKIEC